MKKSLVLAAAALIAAPTLALIDAPAVAAPLCDASEMGFAGLLAKCNRGDEHALTLAAGKPVAEGPIALQSGAYYKFSITADGSQELALAGPEFFRAVWVDEVVINDLEVRPLGLDSFEFDDEGTIELSFVAIKPGSYYLKIPGSSGETQRVDITIQ